MLVQYDLRGEKLIINPDGNEAPILDGLVLKRDDDRWCETVYEAFTKCSRITVGFVRNKILVDRSIGLGGWYYEIDRNTLEGITLDGIPYVVGPHVVL